MQDTNYMEPVKDVSALLTKSLFYLGIEQVGLLDLIVAMLQGGIVGSSYILFTKIYAIRENNVVEPLFIWSFTHPQTLLLLNIPRL